MIKQRQFTGLALWLVILAVTVSGIRPADARDLEKSGPQRTEVEVQLTESFYRALRAEDGRTYTTNKREELLRQIAVSSKFMVETNLKVIENQKRIIELLESMQNSAKN